MSLFSKGFNFDYKYFNDIPKNEYKLIKYLIVGNDIKELIKCNEFYEMTNIIYIEINCKEYILNEFAEFIYLRDIIYKIDNKIKLLEINLINNNKMLIKILEAYTQIPTNIKYLTITMCNQ